MIQFIRKILSATVGTKTTGDIFSGYVAKNSVRLFLLYGAALLTGFISNYILIKTAGVANYGSFVYIFNFLSLLTGFCLAGADNLLVKKTAIYDGDGKHAGMKGVIIFSWLAVLAASALVAAISTLITGQTGIMKERTSINWLLLSLLALPALSMTLINQASLQGLKKVFFSQVTEKLVRPILLIAVVLIFFTVNGALSPTELVWINIAAIMAAMLVTFVLQRQSLPFTWSRTKAQYDIPGWTKAALAFFVLDILYLFNARIDIFFLGLYRSDQEVGVYNIALRVSEIIGFGLLVVNFVLSPLVARLYAGGEMIDLQKIVTRSARAVLWISLPLALAVFLFRHHILSFFDADMHNGGWALAVLCGGQTVNMLCGSVGLLLLMTGHQKYSIFSLLAGTLVNLVLNIWLVPRYGLAGTAFASACSLVVWNLLMYIFVRRKLHLRTTALGI